ncbi:hypothetical protein LCM08_06240 [Salipiger pacificus]|nr:hypothetical protein [Alloyangia pacifica]
MDLSLVEAVALVLLVASIARLGWTVAGRARKAKAGQQIAIRTGETTDGRVWEWVEQADGTVVSIWEVKVES